MIRHILVTGLSSVLCAWLTVIAIAQAAFAADDPASAARSFVQLLQEQKFAEAVARCDTAVQAALPEEKLRAVWTSLQEQSGPFKKQVSTRAERFLQWDVVFVRCQFERQLVDVKVVLDSKLKVGGLFFENSDTSEKAESASPPPYARTNAFREREITVGSGDLALPGTLTLPNGAGLCAGIVLVHGSGPCDRDETVMAAKPFRDLAWGLATHGIGVLRYEKRSKAHPKMLLAGPITTKEEVTDDALAALTFLRNEPRVNSKRVFVLGHSLGAMLAPRIAKLEPDIAGAIMLAAPARPMEDLVLEQTRYLLSLQDSPSEDARKSVGEVEKSVAKIKELKAQPAQLQSQVSGTSRFILGGPPEYWLDLRAYDPVATARSLSIPILLLQGARDYQVTLTDFELWKKALDSQPRATLALYPDLNHLFMSGEGKSTPAEYSKPGYVSEEVITRIANWIDSIR